MTELSDEFRDLPPEYQKVLKLAQEKHQIKVSMLQELKGGQTGAVLYLVSVTLLKPNNVQHLVLKLDHKSTNNRKDELERHRTAVEGAPKDFSANHIADLAFDRVECENAVAIFYNIAGQSLHDYKSLASYQQQNKLEKLFTTTCEYLLSKWNINHSFKQAVHPQNVLAFWLGYRIKPGGNIENFLEETCHIHHDTTGLLIQGHVFPNPLVYAKRTDLWGTIRPIDNVLGFQHGDLNIGNILAKFGGKDDDITGYYLIDFALFKSDMPLFYDLCYLEMSYMIRELSRTTFPKWIDLITRFADQDILDPYQVPIELAGACSVVNSGRRIFGRWIQKNHSSLSDDLWGQYWLAAAAAGLNYCNKSIISENERLAGLIFAAAHLKRFHSAFGVPLPVEAGHIDIELKANDPILKHETIKKQTAFPQHNLPAQATKFIGRQKELKIITELLSHEEVRLLTMTGPGGTGKTRLSLQAVMQITNNFEDGTFFIDLASINDSESLFAAIVRTIGLRRTSDNSLFDEIRKYLRDKKMLLLLDNFEQLTSAAASLKELLRDCPKLKLVITSREALRIRGEQIFPVPPFPLPDTGSKELSAEQLKENDAIQMFIERAAMIRPDFELTEDNSHYVAEICRRLDGLPLAIELAAARINLFSPKTLQERMGSRLKFLKGGARDLPERQQTLRDTIDWSYEMLNDKEQRLFSLLSVFPSCTFDQIEAVTKDISGLVSLHSDIYSDLSSLIDKSLIKRVDKPDSDPRLTMLETIREYASEKLEEDSDFKDEVFHKYAVFFADFAHQQWKLLTGNNRENALKGFETEIENMRSAWKYWVTEGNLEQLQKLTDSLWVLYDARGWYQDTLELTNDLLKVLSSNPSIAEYAQQEITLQMSLARVLMTSKGCTPEVEKAYKRALELCQKHGEIPQTFPVLRALASFYAYRADFEKSKVLGEQILELATQVDDVSMKVEGHLLIGYNLVFSGDLESGMEHLEMAVADYKPGIHKTHRFRFGNNPGIIAYTTSALCLWMMGYPERSLKLAEEAAALADSINHLSSKAYVHFHKGLLHLWRQEADIALKKADEVLVISEKNEFQIWKAVAASLHGAALVGLGIKEDGLREMEYGTNMYTELKTPPVFWPLLLSLRAASFLMAGKPQEGLKNIEEAIDIIGMKSENPIMPEFCRLKGEALLMISTDKKGEAESLFRLAINSAGKQKTKMFELRASLSLYKLLKSNGKQEEGYPCLSEVYKKFTEGFTLADLTEANEILSDSSLKIN